MQNKSLGYLTGKAYKMLSARAQYYIDMEGLSLKMCHFPVISYLWFNDGAPQKQIAGHYGYDRHHTSKILNVLEEDNWIERKPSSNNKREKLIFLTVHAKKKKDLLIKCTKSAINDAFGDVPESKREEMILLLNQIINNLYQITDNG